MSTHEPMWFCHECHAEMRPLMIPDPHCASCRGSFVEMMDNPSDDPRHDGLLPSLLGVRNDSHDGDGGGRPAGGIPNILEALSNMFSSPRDHGSGIGSDGHQGHHDPNGGGGGLRLIINTPSGTRSVRLGGSNISGGSSNRDRGHGGAGGPQSLSDFLASHGSSPNSGPNQSSETRRTPAPLLASYLLSNLFGGVPVVDGSGRMGMFDPFEMLAGGRFGDYVVNEQALQNIMNELMANGGAQPTDPPASEEVIDNLPRVVLDQSHPLASDSCSICHEPFNPALAASPDAFSPSSSSDPMEGSSSLVAVTLPCDHTFHEDCILPWMRMKSTCPVCRKSVLPASQNPGSSSDTNASSRVQQQSNHNAENGSRIPGAWDALD